ncbi:MAG: hypothetical protein OIF50_13135 [Flavobacteriaceae bacterium]|nr:hypothetical protein [Flavobacteriaceae bacterium]
MSLTFVHQGKTFDLNSAGVISHGDQFGILLTILSDIAYQKTEMQRDAPYSGNFTEQNVFLQETERNFPAILLTPRKT